MADRERSVDRLLAAGFAVVVVWLLVGVGAVALAGGRSWLVAVVGLIGLAVGGFLVGAVALPLRRRDRLHAEARAAHERHHRAVRESLEELRHGDLVAALGPVKGLGGSWNAQWRAPGGLSLG